MSEVNIPDELGRPKSLVPGELVERAVGVLVMAFGWHRPAADDAAAVILSDAAPHIARAARIDELRELLRMTETADDPDKGMLRVVVAGDIEARIAELKGRRDV